MLFILATMTSGTSASGGTRLVLFILLLLAILLILTGAVIATVTLWRQRKAQLSAFPLEQLEQEQS